MYTISKDITNELIIKNSRFICILYKINNFEEINEHLKNIRYIYKDATHYCYAYIYKEYKKSSDDGEPGGTAGVPIMQVLEKNNLDYVLCIVIRYFGGIKLGASGLVRAYTRSVTQALEKAEIFELILGYDVCISFSYDKLKQIDYLLNKEYVSKKSFEDLVIYNGQIHRECLDSLKNINDIDIKILDTVYIRK